MQKLALHGGRPVRQTPFPPWPVSGPREEELLRQALFADQWGGYHEFVSQFEQLFARLHDASFGIATANGSLALELALEAAGVGQGDEVIVPAHSFIATAMAVSRVGAVPVFVDIDRETFNLDASLVERALAPETKAIIVVHFGGLMADMDELEALAGRRRLILIEDAAHAHGAEQHGRRAGGIGLGGAFSFQNSKPMTAGEGGILISSDADFAARARSLANCGRRPEGGWFEHFEKATNLRLTAFQAAVLLAQLDRLGDQIRLRSNNRQALEEGLDVPGLSWQRKPGQTAVHTHYLLPGWIDEDAFGAPRDVFVEALNAEGAPCRPFYPMPLYANPVYQKLPHRLTDCRVAEDASRRAFWLPQQVLLGTPEDTQDVVRAIVKIYEQYKPATTRKQ